MSRWNHLVAAALFAAVACGKKDAPSTSTSSSAKSNAPSVPELAMDVPHVEVRGLDFFVDGKAAGTHAPAAGGEVRKEGELFDAMKSLREDWKTAHPGKSFDGICTVEIARGATLQLFLDTLYSVAMAGYPRLFFVVDRGTPAQWTGEIDALIPRPPNHDDAPTPADTALSIVVTPASFSLSWALGAGKPADARTVPRASQDAQRFPELTEAVRAMAKTDAAHGSKADPAHDRAVIYLPKGTPVPELLGIVDALGAITREVDGGDGKTKQVPTFDVVLAASAEPVVPKPLGGLGDEAVAPPGSKIETTEIVVTGKLSPEVVKRILRANFPRFRACYDQARKGAPTLAGVIATRFTIDATGGLESASIDTGKSTLVDPAARACVLGVHRTLAFPEPESGKVSVLHALQFAPPP